MTKIDNTVKRETVYIAIWVITLSIVMQAVFLVIGLWNIKVLAGNLISGIAAVLNFLLMGITIQNAVKKDEKDAAQTMRFSQSARMFMVFAAAAAGVIFFDPITSVVPLFFPRIAIVFRSFTDTKTDKKAN